MKNAMMMIALLTATSAAMASSRDPGSLGSHAAKHSDNTQSISQSAPESDNALVNQQPVRHHSDH